jgi:twitching motility protein PilT
MREDPDIIMIGEMRDPETMQTAMLMAETGHLVISTLHTNDSVQTVDRIVDVFPGTQQKQIRMQLAMSLV